MKQGIEAMLELYRAEGTTFTSQVDGALRDAYISAVRTADRLGAAQQILKDERYGNKMMLDRKEYLEGRVTHLEKEIERLRIQGQQDMRELQKRANKVSELSGEISRLTEKLDRYKRGNEQNAELLRNAIRNESLLKVEKDRVNYRNNIIRQLEDKIKQLEESHILPENYAHLKQKASDYQHLYFTADRDRDDWERRFKELQGSYQSALDRIRRVKTAVMFDEDRSYLRQILDES